MTINAEKDLLHSALQIYQVNNIHIVDSIIAAKGDIEKTSILTFDTKLEGITKNNQ